MEGFCHDVNLRGVLKSGAFLIQLFNFQERHWARSTLPEG